MESRKSIKLTELMQMIIHPLVSAAGVQVVAPLAVAVSMVAAAMMVLLSMLKDEMQSCQLSIRGKKNPRVFLLR